MLLLSVEIKENRLTIVLGNCLIIMNTKRKATEIDSKKLENKSKASKVGESTFKSKPPLKKDLVVQFSDLQNRFDILEKNFQDLQGENEALQNDNHKNLELIKSLKRKLNVYQKKRIWWKM